MDEDQPAVEMPPHVAPLDLPYRPEEETDDIRRDSLYTLVYVDDELVKVLDTPKPGTLVH